jgi:hypothetical protein
VLPPSPLGLERGGVMPKRYGTRPVAACTLLLLLASAPSRGADDTPPPGGLFTPEWPPTPDSAAIRTAVPFLPDLNPWADADPLQPVARTVRSTTTGDWGLLTSNSVLGDAANPPAWDEPLLPREWNTKGDWRCPVMGPVFVFGQFGGGGTEVSQQDTKVAGQTGIGCKWAPVQDAEFTVQSGPSVSYTDPLRPDRVRERSEWLMAVQARWPIFDKVGLEFQGKAAPALTPLDHDWMDQDLGLSAALCPGGTMHFGARHHWENTPDAKASPDSMQLYFGLELKK